MKKRNIFLLVILTLINVFSIRVSANSLGDGSLRLNPSVITNSNIKVGTNGDFLEISELFLKAVQPKNSVFNLPNQTSKVHFGAPVQIHTINFDSKTQQLFRNYHPEVLHIVFENQRTSSALLLYIVMGLSFIGFVSLVILAGYFNAKRHLESYKKVGYGV